MPKIPLFLSKYFSIAFANFLSHNNQNKHPLECFTQHSAWNKCPINHCYYFSFVNFYHMEFSPGLLHFPISSSSSPFPSLPLVLEASVSPDVMAWVSMNISLSISIKSFQRTWFLKWLKESITINLMRPWWAMCWCFPSLTFWLISMIECWRKWG